MVPAISLNLPEGILVCVPQDSRNIQIQRESQYLLWPSVNIFNQLFLHNYILTIIVLNNLLVADPNVQDCIIVSCTTYTLANSIHYWMWLNLTKLTSNSLATIIMIVHIAQSYEHWHWPHAVAYSNNHQVLLFLWLVGDLSVDKLASLRIPSKGSQFLSSTA